MAPSKAEISIVISVSIMNPSTIIIKNFLKFAMIVIESIIFRYVKNF